MKLKKAFKNVPHSRLLRKITAGIMRVCGRESSSGSELALRKSSIPACGHEDTNLEESMQVPFQILEELHS